MTNVSRYLGYNTLLSNRKVSTDRHRFYNEKEVHQALLLGFFIQRYTEIYQIEIEHFIECVSYQTNNPR